MYLIIGGSGFIGTRLCKRLENNNEAFKILDKNKTNTFANRTIKCDIREKNTFLNSDTDASIIVNLAAEHKDNVSPKSLYHKVNVEGARSVCEFATRKNINTIIFTSSVAVYGFTKKEIDENGEINPFNEYGQTKHEAELVYQNWQEKDPQNRCLVIIRPTVVFGEGNRGNVYNLLNQIASGKFVMIGNGQNRKSMAYVENVAAFIQHVSKLKPGSHVYNYIDKPDFDMNNLIRKVKKLLGQNEKIRIRVPYVIGMAVGYMFDLAAIIIGKKLPISSIRIQKFCKNSTYATSFEKTTFTPPVDLEDAITNTIQHEFSCKK